MLTKTMAIAAMLPECMDDGGMDAASGSFPCTQLRSSGATIDAPGTFTAAA